MSQTKISDLLPINPSNAKPNAYDVFGLTAGESDAQRIKSAMRGVYQQLKQSRDSADPKVWNQALKIAEAARQTLEDPNRKQKLDAAIASAPAAIHASTATSKAAADPLADLLPSSNPIQENAARPSPAATNQAAAVLGMPPLGSPPLGAPAPAPPATSPPAPQSASPQIATAQPSATSQPFVTTSENASAVSWTPPKSKTKKRRRKKSGMLLLGGFVVAMLGVIIYLLVFLETGTNQKVAQTDDQVVVSKPQPPAANRDPRAKSDGVIGSAPSSGIADSIRNRNPNPNKMGIGSMPAAQDNMPAENMNSMPETPPMNMADPDSMMANEPEKPAEPTPQQLQQYSQEIESLEQLIRDAKWDQMKPEADRLIKKNIPGELGSRVSTLYDIADLASYYRGGIVRGLSSRQTGNTFDLVEGFPVIVVQASTQSIAIQFNKQTREYTLETLPPTLMEKLASFALQPEQPDVQAALALYRLVHPATNDEYRQDAWAILESVDGKLQNVDTKELIKVARELFPTATSS
ncbi:hypothetical protein LOC67_01360 [Stieleria sp. JC731]|uniref:hypothetical protein n=1 Tax=Pirellulaceae TaxID=2691357 RepID=UPI001E51512A|nr:hypothetical protein [Stieleria sp. JC731]MCC9599190.1 hypothetical protein [Stieleria sp. JC731]